MMANWIDGCIDKWDNKNQDWKRYNENMVIILQNLTNFTLEYINKAIKIKYYGITQDPQTKNYMLVLSNECEKCNYTCNAMHFRENFENWTSGDNDIDNFIQDTQLSAHYNKEALEWLSYDSFYDIRCIAENDENNILYRANWIDGYIVNWNKENQNWERDNQDMIVTLKILNDPNVVTLEFTNEIKRDYEFYGITQDPQTKNYMMVFNIKCKKCNCICNAMHFQQNFVSWTSGSDHIDKLIRDTQLSVHDNYDVYKNVLEWIPYNRFDNINYVIENKIFEANWVDGYINKWNKYDQSWKRNNQNMLIILKILNDPKNIKLEFTNEINRLYGITQDPKTKYYMLVLNDICKKCNCICNAIHFQQNFGSWTKWIPYDRFNNIKHFELLGTYKANWIDGNINYWNYGIQHWERFNKYMNVILKNLNDSKNIATEYKYEAESGYEFCGITQEP
ncbi:kinase-like domain-containing protein [Rhizophagus clarus]|uniref:Kinase-like domain-containing protein n=1 Tax=Rhizophagus clarus TaxID=94130 RepID=A0A8H3L4X3_9GLOM|nr:kinase-like domain-containing protein [Rhizophagus clarus]